MDIRKRHFLFIFIIVAILISQIHAIRVHFDYTYLDQDESQRSCYTSGQSFVRGDPSSESCELTNNAAMLTVPPQDCIGTCQIYDVITNSHKSIMKNTVMPVVSLILNDLLNLKSEYMMPNDVFLLNSETNSTQRCQFTTEYGVPILDSMYKSGPSLNQSQVLTGVDLVVFVTMRPLTSTVRGSGMVCVRQTFNGVKRPIMGLINISPTQLSGLSQRQRVMVVLHMMVSILFHFFSHCTVSYFRIQFIFLCRCQFGHYITV